MSASASAETKGDRGVPKPQFIDTLGLRRPKTEQGVDKLVMPKSKHKLILGHDLRA
jgi:hypothetical protein